MLLLTAFTQTEDGLLFFLQSRVEKLLAWVKIEATTLFLGSKSGT